MELKEKQDYLFTQILQANYDPEEFQEFMEKEKGVNLDSYTMDELKRIVHRFKGNTQQQQPHLDQSKQQILPASQKSKDAANHLEMSELAEQEVKEERKHIESANTSTKVFHQLIKKTAISKLLREMSEGGGVRVKIRSYCKESEETLFGSTYVAYLLESSNGWSVKRRFKDFEWLHSRLSQAYPGLPVPPIPKKTAIRSFQDSHLEQRMSFFEQFVNRMLHIPQICSDPILEEFLSIPSQQEFAACKERYQILLSNSGNKIVSLKGEHVINKGEFAVDPKQAKYHTVSLDLLHQLNAQISAFQKALRTASDLAFELASSFATNYQHLLSNDIVSCQVVELMGQFVSELGYRLDGECFFVKRNLEDYWGYEEKYQENLLWGINKINKEQFELLSKSKAQHSEMDIDDSSTKNKPIAQYLAAKETYRIRLSFLLEELERHRTQDFGNVAKDWVGALQQYVGGIKDLMLSGADQLTKALCVCEGKKLVEVQYLSSRQRQPR